VFFGFFGFYVLGFGFWLGVFRFLSFLSFLGGVCFGVLILIFWFRFVFVLV